MEKIPPAALSKVVFEEKGILTYFESGPPGGQREKAKNKKSRKSGNLQQYLQRSIIKIKSRKFCFLTGVRLTALLDTDIMI